MNLKSPHLILLLSLLFCVSPTVHGIERRKRSLASTINSINKWTNVGVKAAHHEQEDALETAIPLIEAVGDAIPVLSPLATLVSGFLDMKQQSDLSVILGKFDEMNGKLDHLDARISEVLARIASGFEQMNRKFDQLGERIDSGFALTAYAAKLDALRTLRNEYRRFTDNPTLVTQEDFARKCLDNQMMALANWIEGGVNDRHHHSLYQVMTNNFDMKQLNWWTLRLLAHLSETIFFHTTCVGMRNHTAQVIKTTLRGDTAIFQKILNGFARGFNRARKHIRKNFFAAAYEEVKDSIRADVDGLHWHFATQLHSKLQEKYYWRDWVVASWDDSADTFCKQNHPPESSNVWYWHQHQRRCLMVGSTLPDLDRDEELKLQIDRCLSDHKPNTVYYFRENDDHRIERDIHEHVFQKCPHLKMPIAEAAVIRSGHGFHTSNTIGKSVYVTTEVNYVTEKKSRPPPVWGGFAVLIDSLWEKIYSGIRVVAIGSDLTTNSGIGEDYCTSFGYCEKDYHCCQHPQYPNGFTCYSDTSMCARGGVRRPFDSQSMDAD